MARDCGQSAANFIREKVGLRCRPMGRPTVNELAEMEEATWELLQQLGVDPVERFPPNPAQVSAEQEDTPLAREVRIARLRAMSAKLGLLA